MSLLIENIVNALADSETIADWCDSLYGKDQTVQLGIDLDRLPDQGSYPIIMVAQVSGREGKALANEEAVFVIACGIVDESEPVTEGRVASYAQVTDLEKFRVLVMSAVESADLSGGYVTEVEVENDPVELFPIFSTNNIVRIHCPTAMRSRWVK